MTESCTPRKKIPLLWKAAVACWIFLVSLFSAALYLKTVPPTAKPEHLYLFSLFNPGTGETNHFLRLDRLSSDYFYVGAHGNTDGSPDESDRWIEDNRSGKTILLAPTDAAALITAEKAKRGVSPALPVFIMACNSGRGGKAYAQEVSRSLKEDVYAVDGWLVVDQLGISRTSKGGFLATYLNYGNFEVRKFKQGNEILFNVAPL